MIRAYQGKSPVVPSTCWIDPSAQIVGDVVLGEHVSVWFNAVVRGDVNSIRVGAQSNIQDCAVLHGMRGLYPVYVGQGVSIGHSAVVHGCTVEDHCLIGIGSMVLNNARIGEGSIVAAGALVPEGAVIPPRSLVMGMPGKVRRSITDEDYLLIQRTAANYLDYAAEYKRG